MLGGITMPFYLKDRNISLDIAKVHSVLIVPCRFCPAASLAVREEKPYLGVCRSTPNSFKGMLHCRA